MASIPIRQRIRSAIGSVVRKRLAKSRDRFLNNARLKCEEVQQQTLTRILHLNADSEFSRQHELNASLAAADFQQQFPVSNYETFRPAIDQMVSGNHRALLGRSNKLLMYALTSGTTSQAKRIPITQQFVKDYRRGWQHWGISVHETYPDLKLLKMVQLNSRHEVERTKTGTPCGNISGLVTAMQSPIIRKLYSIPSAVAMVDDPVQRRILAARYAIQDSWAGMFVTANPSSLISLLNAADENVQQIIRDIADGTISCDPMPAELRKRLASKLKPDPSRAEAVERIVRRNSVLVPQELWPDMCVLGVWTGGSVAAYLPELRRRFGDLPIRDHGLHASEGRMTIPVEDNSSSGILDIESHFFEFLPQPETNQESTANSRAAASSSRGDQILMAHQLEVGCCYEILLTTSSGLYRYNIHDVVRCTGYFGTTPMLEFLHKSAHMSSITGEKITEFQVVAAVTDALAAMGYGERGGSSVFTLTPSWGDPPAYRLFVSQDLSERQLLVLAETADARLAHHNCEYDDKRRSGRLAGISCRRLTSQQWKQLNSDRLQSSGGSQEQYKHPFLMPDPKFERAFERSVGLV